MKLKTIRIIVLPLLLSLIVIILIISLLCTNTDTDKNRRIVMLIKTINPAIDFWQIVKAGAEIAAEEYNIELEIKGPWFEKDIDNQITIAESIIKEKPAAILLAACDIDALVPVAEKIVINNITLLTIDSGLNSSLPASFIGTDNFKAGQKLGTQIEELLAPGDIVAIIAHVRVTATSIERERGVKDILEKSGKLSIIGTYFCDNIADNAYQITKDLLESNKSIKGIIALNEISTLGTARAILDLGLGHKISLIGFDNGFKELQFLEQGIIKALVVQKPFNMGYMGIKMTVDVLNNKQVPDRIDTGSTLITLENMHTPENQKLLFPLSLIKSSRKKDE